MISYDILQNLENNCFELLNATTGMISGSNEKSMGKSHQNIVRALRKIVIANEMMGKGIICISGLQGAGKSTLMKNFYGLSDEYFNIKTGVGEKIPVDISLILGYLITVIFDYQIPHKPLKILSL